MKELSPPHIKLIGQFGRPGRQEKAHIKRFEVSRVSRTVEIKKLPEDQQRLALLAS